MIRVEELSYGVPAKELYKDISFTIDKGQHCALIGVNGTGKTTLADILIKPEEYLYDGKVIKDDSCRIGYANQFSLAEKEQECTVIEYLSERFVKIQQEIADACEEMAVTDDIDSALARYQQLLDLNESMDGDNYESNIYKQLYTAGMLDVKERKINQLSGGEYKVIQIVKEMLLAPNLLILDEPDAFLDFENLNSISNLINEYKAAMLVITHNRYLLNHCFNKILHLEGGEMQEYDGNYTEYRVAQLRNKLEIKRQHLEEEAEIERTQEMVDVLRKRATLMVNPTIGRTVNAKQSQLDRLRSRHIDAPVFELREPEIIFPEVKAGDKLAKGEKLCGEFAGAAKLAAEGKADYGEPNFIENGDTVQAESFYEATGPKTVLELRDYSVTFNKCILDNVNFEIKAGEKVAIVGANGAGKTTLVRDIMKNDHPAVYIDESTKFACLSQIQGDAQEAEETVLQFMQDAGFGIEEKVKRKLQRCGLGEVEVNQKVGNLSIGEQNLLHIAALANSDAELLILDEPTSHLDIYTQMALETAVSEYKGTVLMISHDFYLVANCADYVLLIEDNTLRRIRGRKFRKMVYDRYFDQKYLETDKKKQELEAGIAAAFKNDELDKVEKLCDQLEEISR